MYTLDSSVEEHDFIEFFAGDANVSRCLVWGGLSGAFLDKAYHTPARKKQNFMDILTPAGMAQLGKLEALLFG